MPNTRSDRLFWILEELGVPYDVAPHVANKGRLPERVTPLGKSPVLEVDGEVLSETGSIVQRLLASKAVPGLERFPSAQSNHWSLFSEGTMMLHLQPARVLGIMSNVVEGRLTPEEAKGARALNELFRAKWADPNIQLQLNTVEKYLKDNRHFTGTDEIGLGDVIIMMLFPVSTTIDGFRKGEFDVGPNTRRWMDAMRTRPAYVRGMQRQTEEEALINERASKL